MPIYFPSDDIVGFRRSRFYAQPRAWEKVTDSYEYEDGTKTFNEVADDAPRRWEYEYSIARATAALAEGDAAIFDAFYDTVRRSVPFLFRDKYGTVWDNVRIEDYSRTHADHRSWRIAVRFKLVGYGSVGTPAPDTTPPSIPLNLTAVATNSSHVATAWLASIDPPLQVFGLAGYELLVDGTTVIDVGNVLGTTVGGLAPGTLHTFRVRSYDSATPRNRSDYSNIASATTPPLVTGGVVDGSNRALVDASGRWVVFTV